MKLLHFEEYVDDLILKRGMDYFHQDQVKETEAKANNRYIMKVAGSADYTVEVFLDNDKEEIVDTSCNCPYDRGDYCKHQAASFFVLRNELLGESNKKQVKKPLNKKVDLETLVSNLRKDELVRIVLNVAEENEEFEKELLFTYAPVENEIAASKKLMREFISQAK